MHQVQTNGKTEGSHAEFNQHCACRPFGAWEETGCRPENKKCERKIADHPRCQRNWVFRYMEHGLSLQHSLKGQSTRGGLNHERSWYIAAVS